MFLPADTGFFDLYVFFVWDPLLFLSLSPALDVANGGGCNDRGAADDGSCHHNGWLE